MEPLLVLAHGAGAGSGSPWMQRWAARLAELGTVVTFDYPYVTRGRRMPDPLPVLVKAHREAVESACRAHERRVVLIGKSMGSRVGCHLSLEVPVAGLVCFGYPLLHPSAAPSNRSKMRNEVLQALTTPILFIQGTRDPLCPLPLLAAVRQGLRAASELEVVEGGNHSLELTQTELRKRAITQVDVDQGIAGRIRQFVRALSG